MSARLNGQHLLEGGQKFSIEWNAIFVGILDHSFDQPGASDWFSEIAAVGLASLRLDNDGSKIHQPAVWWFRAMPHCHLQYLMVHAHPMFQSYGTLMQARA